MQLHYENLPVDKKEDRNKGVGEKKLIMQKQKKH